MQQIPACQMRYLQLLAREYPSIQAASIALIRLSAQLNLPKGTEHFLSDIHGEYEAFRHVLKNGSGSIRRKIDALFTHTLSTQEKRNLATLIYYPEQKLPLLLKTVDDPAQWYRRTLCQLRDLCRVATAKYSPAQVRAFLPAAVADLIDELLQEHDGSKAKQHYFQSLLEAIISSGTAGTLIVALAELIQRSG